ncbi:MAG: acyl carrier protein [Planctomycetes bacterium]|nr:acyl carrier protein [Planctomycetota bacterium]
MEDINQYKGRVRAFLSTWITRDTFGDDDHLFEKGHVNSMMAIDLVLFVESEFSVTVTNEDLSIANFKSVNSIAEFVDKKVNRVEYES